MISENSSKFGISDIAHTKHISKKGYGDISGEEASQDLIRCKLAEDAEESGVLVNGEKKRKRGNSVERKKAVKKLK